MKEMLAKGNIEEIAYTIKMKEILDMPQLLRFSNSIDYSKLEKIVMVLSDKKVIIKTLRELSKFSDYEDEDFSNGKMINLMKCFDNNTPKIISIIRQFTDQIHQMKEIIPDFLYCNKEDTILVFDKIKKYNKRNFMELIGYLNHKKVQQLILENTSIKKIKFEIDKIKSTLLKRKESLSYRKEYGPNYKTFLDIKRNKKRYNFTFIPDMMFDNLKFIKDPIEASYWGKETMCCLKEGGAAKELLMPIETSPIAGEIVGTFRKHKISSYTWDMVECINGKAYKTLILDNIESPTMINQEDTEYLFDKLYSFGKYKTIYLGTIRNDCTVYGYESRPRQSLLPGYDYIFKKNIFTHADSDNVYLIREHKEDTEYKVREMNISDLHLCKYIEKYIYGEDIYNEKEDKTDILKQVTLDTPCYIIDNTTNIYGYLLTKWKFFNEEGKEVSAKNGIKRFYIEDLVIGKEYIKELKTIFNNLEKWLLENDIKEVYLNTNDNSKNFKKRLERIGIKVVEENIGKFMPINYLK